MLYYFCTRRKDLAGFVTDGEVRRKQKGIHLWTSLDRAKKNCAGALLVVDSWQLPDVGIHADTSTRMVESVPAAAICNLDPYAPLRPVTAAGGITVRRFENQEPEVLLILRRGVWDLPKGKRHKGETIETCALREVREEVGIIELYKHTGLGTTVHGYRDGEYYRVKTTHWFLMTTPESVFTPQIQEEIEEVAWFTWTEAKQKIGYETLRILMETIETEILIQ